MQDFDGLFGNSPSGIIILDKQNSIEYGNQAFCSLIGREKCDLKELNITSIILPDDLKAQMPLILKLTKEEISSFEFEFRLLHENGSTLWVRSAVYTIMCESRPGDRLGIMIFTNINERKAYEQTLLKLTGTLTHDLVSPLSQIEGYVALIKERELLSEKADCFLTIIENSAQHARSLIIEILENATLDADNFEKYKRTTDIVQLLNSYLPNFTLQAKTQNIWLDIQLPNTIALANISDTHIKRVLANLLTNAFKFTPEGGRIEVIGEIDNNYIIVKVQDSGIGIPENLQSDLFKPFSFAQRKGLKGERSTGLGMYILKQIILLHNGEIQLSSKEENGTCITVSLPLI